MIGSTFVVCLPFHVAVRQLVLLLLSNAAMTNVWQHFSVQTFAGVRRYGSDNTVVTNMAALLPSHIYRYNTVTSYIFFHVCCCTFHAVNSHFLICRMVAFKKLLVVLLVRGRRRVVCWEMSQCFIAFSKTLPFARTHIFDALACHFTRITVDADAMCKLLFTTDTIRATYIVSTLMALLRDPGNEPT